LVYLIPVCDYYCTSCTVVLNANGMQLIVKSKDLFKLTLAKPNSYTG